ncbi:mechanosensitive ion channel [Peptoniphilus raoultii]|uniref:mechanosensitive ion channel n=1 Tax=Peptoniphilus raoultii TaxID=1776387 RepID=UPI0008D97DA9|nr:mechanosensitive ion channel [Peptoniphilus raoultii]
MDIFQFNFLELGGIVDSLSPTSRYISLTNRYIFEKTLINYSRGDLFLIQETYILVDFNEDMEKVMKIAGKVAYEKQNLIIEGYRQDDKAEKLEKFAKKLELTDYEVKAIIRR